MTGVIATIPKFQFSANGVPMVLGTLTVYLAGTTTPTDTWQDSALSSLNTNPVVLDSRGECVLWLDSTKSYKFVLKNAGGVTQWTQDNISGADAHLRGDLAASGGASLVGYLPAGTGAVATTVQSKLRESVSVLDFGAIGNGVANDTAAIKAAISSGAKHITSPTGKSYLIDDTLTIDGDRITFDLQGSFLILNDPTGLKSHIFLGNGTTQRNDIKIRNIAFERVQVATAGYAIGSNYIGMTEISGCTMYGGSKLHGGINLYRSIVANVFNNQIQDVINYGIYVQGSGTGNNRTIDTSIRENRIDGGASALVTWDYVEGMFVRDNIFLRQSAACVSASASSNVTGLVSFKFQDNDFDGAGGVGLYLENISNTHITGNWFSSNTGIDIDIGTGADSVLVSANQIYPINHGIRVAGSNVLIDSNIISGGLTGVYTQVVAANLKVSNNKFMFGQTAIDLVNLPPAAHIVGNDISSMSVSTIAGLGGAGTVIQNNRGDAFVGTNSYISVSASPFTYTTGPRPEYVSILTGTVSAVSLSSTNIAFVTDTSVHLAPNQSVTVTYSSAPTMVRNIL